MEPTESGQIERERERVPFFSRTPIRAARLGTYIPICSIWGNPYLILKTRGDGWDGKNTRSFFCSKSFQNNIYQRYKKRPANLHTLPTLGNDQDTSEEGSNSFIPRSSRIPPTRRHTRERARERCGAVKAITTSRHPSCRNFSYLPA